MVTPVRSHALLLVAYVLLVAGLGWLSVEAPPHVIPIWVIPVLACAGVPTLMGCRRYPRSSFAAALVITLVSCAIGTLAEAFVVLSMLYLAGARRSARAAWLSFATVVVVGVLGAFILARRLATGPSLWGTVASTTDRDLLLDWGNIYVIISVIALVVTLMGINIGHRRRHVAALVQWARQMERERDQQALITSAEERERIAREMHDVIAHSLAVMIAMADGAHATAVHRPEVAKQAMGRVADVGRRTLDEVRRLLGSVQGEPPPDVSRLQALSEEFAQAGLPVHLTVVGDPPQDGVLGLTIYRIVQESLTNVLRHAHDPHGVTVEITWTEEMVEITVEDDSAPVTTQGHPGRGLLGIRERVALYDGHVTTGPRPEGGWRVHARLHTQNIR